MIPPHDLDEPTETGARLLRSARSYRASDKIRKSTLEAVNAALATNAAAPPTKDLGGPFRQMLSSPNLALGVLALAVGFAAVVPLRTRETSESREASEAKGPSGRPVAESAPVPVPVPVPTMSVTDIPLVPPPKPAIRTAAPSSHRIATVEPKPASMDSLTLEIAALDRARRALKQKDPIAALEALDAHRKRFPSGSLRPEATALRVEALLARGDDAEARALAEAFLADHATSPLAPRVRSLIGATQD